MPGTDNSSTTRRDLLQGAAAGGAAAALLGMMGINPALAAEVGRSEKPLKAAFSNAGLQATWCAQGKQAAEYWGSLFNVEVTWFDGQLDAVKQRSAIDNMASQKWDFVAVQAFGIGTLTAPLQKLIDADSRTVLLRVLGGGLRALLLRPLLPLLHRSTARQHHDFAAGRLDLLFGALAEVMRRHF